MTAPHPDPRVGTDLGPYRIERVLGRGGMGVVYLAEQPSLSRKVALKVIAPEFSEEPRAKARFLRESRMAAAIDHPNILPIHEAGEIDGVLFIAMRYVDGEDLARRLAREPLSPRAAVAILAQVAAALDAAHARGLIHRDVKPANILLDPTAGPDGSDHAYLTDFGLTKRGGSEGSLTAVGGFAGTLAYIAPEQVEGGQVDGRTDEYSLVCVAFECLTGRPPFERETDIALAMAHLHDPVLPASGIGPELPAAVNAVIAKGLAKDPNGRYPDGRSFVDALRDALGVSETHSRAMAQPERTTDRRVPVVAATVMGIGILAAMGVVLTAGGARAPTSSPSSSLAMLSPSASADASPTLDVYPNVLETALLGTLPADLTPACSRGSYAAIHEGITPLASIRCLPDFETGANELLVRRFAHGDYSTDTIVLLLADTAHAEIGDCGSSPRAHGRWKVGGKEKGEFLCYLDGPSGDAIYYWSYPEGGMLVKATNQRGDSAALDAFFEQYARFFAP